MNAFGSASQFLRARLSYYALGSFAYLPRSKSASPSKRDLSSVKTDRMLYFLANLPLMLSQSIAVFIWNFSSKIAFGSYELIRLTLVSINLVRCFHIMTTSIALGKFLIWRALMLSSIDTFFLVYFNGICPACLFI